MIRLLTWMSICADEKKVISNLKLMRREIYPMHLIGRSKFDNELLQSGELMS